MPRRFGRRRGVGGRERGGREREREGEGERIGPIVLGPRYNSRLI